MHKVFVIGRISDYSMFVVVADSKQEAQTFINEPKEGPADYPMLPSRTESTAFEIDLTTKGIKAAYIE